MNIELSDFFYLSICISFLIFGADDFLIDFIAWIKKLGPKELDLNNQKKIASLPERKIAILLAAWKEDGVISGMIRGNRGQIQYSNYDFFLGVYPNDLNTLKEAEDLSKEFSNVHVIVNRHPGPTSKGQMLNEIIRQMQLQNYKYQIILIHDAEDVIHPLSLKIINWRTRYSDFVQVPVFSLHTPQMELVAGLYVDEFAESHTKDMLVRQYMNAPIPSAGVGTAMTKSYVQKMLKYQNGQLFNPNTVTEDYQLGLLSTEIKSKTEFACYFIKDNNKKNFIATREYFPKKIRASIRQRSRWVLGIAYQSFKSLGWKGSLAQKYFLFRDRKGPIANTLTCLGFSLFFIEPKAEEALYMLPIIVFFACNRVFQRFFHTSEVYGAPATWMLIPRMILGNFINAAASIRATYQYLKYVVAGIEPVWLKTSHELPFGFGQNISRVVNMKVIPLFLFFLTSFLFPQISFAEIKQTKDVCVYYDNIPGAVGTKENSAIMLANLLGHFKSVRPTIRGALSYKNGEFQTCDFIIYIGGYFDSPLSQNFLNDLHNSKKRRLWIGFNIWKLENSVGREDFKNIYGFNYHRVAGFGGTHITDIVPSFYQYFSYKGEVFEKYFYYSQDQVVADPDIMIVKNESAKVISYAVHSKTKDSTPYILEKNNFFWVGDRGFSYIHEADRYLIIADLLFDFLQEAPERGPRKAFIRLEDIDPTYNLVALQKSIKILSERKAAFGISLIPRFVSEENVIPQINVSLLERPEFLKTIYWAQRAGGQILLHGYTHAAENIPNCPSLKSGDEFEFWDRCAWAPLPYDSEDYVHSRLIPALDLLKKARLRHKAWVTPHYLASPLDFKIFAQYFSRTIQRVLYVSDKQKSTKYGASQFFPYTIYKDYYGQWVYPENLGFFSHEDPMSSARRMVSNAKRNLVLRDTWASFFWHPFIGSNPKNLQALDYAVKEIQALGYQFYTIKEDQP